MRVKTAVPHGFRTKSPTSLLKPAVKGGHDERERSTTGWAALTPTEREVVPLVSEDLANKDIATRLFISPRPVQTHLSDVFAKLSITSRVQLVQGIARHG